MSVVVFDAKEHAKYPVPPLPGATLLTADIREVYASASESRGAAVANRPEC